jgi:hypothetical protein
VIFKNNKMQSAIKAAEGQTAKRQKVVAILNSEVRKLSDTAGRLTEAGNAFADRAADRLISGSTEEVADDTVTRVRSEIKRAGVTISGLRSAVRGLIPGFIEASRSIASELPAHHQGIESAFRQDWEKAVSTFSVMLGRRSEIERALGRKLDLASPAAVMPDPQLVAEALRPMELLASIAPYLEAAAATVFVPSSEKAKGFDADRVHILDRPYLDNDGLSLDAGTPVVEECFSPGMLRLLVEVGHAYRAEDPRIATTRHIANGEILRARAAEADRQRLAESAGGTKIVSESPVEIPEGMSYQDVARPQPDLPGGPMGRHNVTGTALPWKEVLNKL